jgi:hypothetical protein
MTKQHLTPIKAVGPWGTTSYRLGGIEVQGFMGMFKLDNWWNNWDKRIERARKKLDIKRKE